MTAVRANSRWYLKEPIAPWGRWMWVLPPQWYPKHDKHLFPAMVAGKKLCMTEGYERPLLWLSSEEIRSQWKPSQAKTDRTPLPHAVQPKMRVTWHVNDKRSMPIEVIQVNRKVGWVIVVACEPINEEDYQESVSKRTSRFHYCEARYTCFFCDTTTFLQNTSPIRSAKPGFWDRIRQGGAMEPEKLVWNPGGAH